MSHFRSLGLKPAGRSPNPEARGPARTGRAARRLHRRRPDRDRRRPDQDYRVRHPIELQEGRANLEVLPGSARRRARRADTGAGQAVRPGISRPRLRRNRHSAASKRPQRAPRRARRCRACAARSPPAAPRLCQRHVLSGRRSRARGAGPAFLFHDRGQTPSRCGQWPNDLASGSSLNGWENKEYWNFGCASQQMVAAQVADPRDLMGPAAETPPDSQIVGRAIDAVRQGKDPGTSLDHAEQQYQRHRKLSHGQRVSRSPRSFVACGVHRPDAARFVAGVLRDVGARRAHRRSGERPPHGKSPCQGQHGRRRRGGGILSHVAHAQHHRHRNPTPPAPN